MGKRGEGCRIHEKVKQEWGGATVNSILMSPKSNSHPLPPLDGRFALAFLQPSTNEQSIGWLRHAEIKHGRVAMFAFVGFIVHANQITWPWPMTTAGDPFPKADSAPAAWDAIPEAAKIQILLFVGFLEFWSEANMEKHYMRGGKPGDFPDFNSKYIPGGALNLYDPFGWNKNLPTESKVRTRGWRKANT